MSYGHVSEYLQKQTSIYNIMYINHTTPDRSVSLGPPESLLYEKLDRKQKRACVQVKTPSFILLQLDRRQTFQSQREKSFINELIHKEALQQLLF